MDPLEGLLYGLELALQPELLLAALFGCLIGAFVGVLPGLGAVAGAALVLPMTFGFSPAVGLIMISGVYLGSQFGGSISSILLNIPGDASSVVAAFDGYPLAKKGRAGAAIVIMSIGSFIATFLSVGIMLLVMPSVMSVALSFQAPEYFALTAGSLLILAALSAGNFRMGLIAVSIGLVIGSIGSEITESYPRFTFGASSLSLGVSIATVAVGLYAVSELLFMAEARSKNKEGEVSLKNFFPTKKEYKEAAFPWVRGGIIGFLFGLIPGPSATLSTFFSYNVEKTISRDKKKFGNGAVAGLAGPEASNMAAAVGSIVPILMLGLPFSATLALMLSAMVVHGIQPGPLLATQHPDIFWSVIGAVVISGVLLLFLNLPLARVWVKILKIPSYYIMLIVASVSFIGAYSINGNFVDVTLVVALGILGYVLRKIGFSLAAVLLGAVLGPLVEEYLIRGLYIYDGNLAAILGSSWISIIIWAVVLVVFVGLFFWKQIIPKIHRSHKLPEKEQAI